MCVCLAPAWCSGSRCGRCAINSSPSLWRFQGLCHASFFIDSKKPMEGRPNPCWRLDSLYKNLCKRLSLQSCIVQLDRYSLSGAVLNRPYSSRPWVGETLCGSIVVNIPEWRSFSTVGSRNPKRAVGFGDGAPNNPWATWTRLIPGNWTMSRKAGKRQMLTALSSSLSFGCSSSLDPPSFGCSSSLDPPCNAI